MPLRPLLFSLLSLVGFDLFAAQEDVHSSSAGTSTKPAQYWALPFTPSKTKADSLDPVIDMLTEVTSRLPEYQHHFQLMSLSRSFTDLPNRTDLCVASTARTAERDQIGYFVGLWPLMPPQVIIRREDWHIINNNQRRVSLQALLQRPNLHGATITKRSYGPVIDNLLAEAAANDNFDSLQTSSKTNNLFKMLDKGRIDFTTDYLESFLYNTQEQPELRESLMLLPIDEAQQLITVGIYCPRTPQGEQMIRRIDQIVRDPKIVSRFEEILRDVVPAEQRKAFQQKLDEFYQTRPHTNLTNLPD